MIRFLPFRFFCALLALVVLAGGAGCATRKPFVPTGVVKVAVLDGVMADGQTETRRSVAGWWIFAKDRFDSGTAGILVADTLSEEFRKSPGVQILSRIDLRGYMAQKERMLDRAYPELDPASRTRVLQEQSPVDYGKSLNVDYVITSKVNRARMVHNRTIHSWMSTVDFDVQVWNIQTGAVVWQWKGRDSDWFSSQASIIEELAGEARTKAEASGVFRAVR